MLTLVLDNFIVSSYILYRIMDSLLSFVYFNIIWLQQVCYFLPLLSLIFLHHLGYELLIEACLEILLPSLFLVVDLLWLLDFCLLINLECSIFWFLIELFYLLHFHHRGWILIVYLILVFLHMLLLLLP